MFLVHKAGYLTIFFVLQTADVTCNGNGPVTKNSFEQLTNENKALKNR